MLRIFIIGLLLLRLTQVGSEMIESVLAIAEDIDDCHGDNVEPDPEHGCTALVHQCSCHSIAADVDVIALADPLLRAMRANELTLASPTLEPDPARLLRPPTA